MNRGSSLSRGSGAHDSDTSDIAWEREGERRESRKKFRLQSDILPIQHASLSRTLVSSCSTL